MLLGDVQVRLKWLRQARNELEMKVAELTAELRRTTTEL